MAYTVKELAKLSGVSIRTLHFYDEIGLLKPARYGENGYRYYGEEELLILQQILFYRELGFQLSEIQRIVNSDQFDKVEALKSHRELLKKNAEHTQELINTIDKTITKLTKGGNMKDEEIYYGFDKKKQEEYENYLIDHYGEKTKKLIGESKRRVKSMTKGDFKRSSEQIFQIHTELASAIRKRLQPASPEVQEVIRRHYTWVSQYYTPTKEVYAGLGQLYLNHPDFRKMYDSFDHGLAQFMADSMKVFADENL